MNHENIQFVLRIILLLQSIFRTYPNILERLLINKKNINKFWWSFINKKPADISPESTGGKNDFEHFYNEDG